jgi:hypothetical protein
LAIDGYREIACHALPPAGFVFKGNRCLERSQQRRTSQWARLISIDDVGVATASGSQTLPAQ